MEIVTGRAIDFNKHCKAQLGSYVEVHEDRLFTNTQHPQTFPGIYLSPTGNIQGILKVFDITTGVVKKTQTMKELPIPDQVITLVYKCSMQSRKEDMHSRFEFLNHHKQKFDW